MKTEIQKYNEALVKSGYSTEDTTCLVALAQTDGWVLVVEGLDNNWITTKFYKRGGEYADTPFSTDSLVEAIQYANDLHSK